MAMSRATNKGKDKLLDITSLGLAEQNEIIGLLQRGSEVKQQIGEKPDSKKGKPGSGLLKEVDEIADKLMAIQMANQLEGLRYGRLAFTSRLQPGRETVSMEVFKEQLVLAGVDVDTIVECESRARKTGDMFPVREIQVLSE